MRTRPVVPRFAPNHLLFLGAHIMERQLQLRDGKMKAPSKEMVNSYFDSEGGFGAANS